MNFETSTHCQRWLYTPEKLAIVREERHKRTAEALAQAQARLQQQQGEEPESDGQPGKKGKKLRPPSLADESILLKYYKGRVQELCRAFGFPCKVQAAAITFLARFYLRHSPLEHDTKDTMLACLYLAGKVEEAYIGAEEMCKRLQQKPDTLLNLEPRVLQGLGFDLITYSPHAALAGFFMDLTGTTGAGSSALEGVTEQQVADAKKAARAAADALVLTDAPLLFPPGQLALAAMRSGFNKVKVNFAEVLAHIAGKAGASGGASAESSLTDLKAAISSIDTFGAEGSQFVSAEEARKVDKRVKACQGILAKAAAAQEKPAGALEQKQSGNGITGVAPFEPASKRLKLEDL